MTPLVSIVIPCHNAAPWLAETIESALAQTYPSTEIVIVDDGSRDDSLAIARDYVGRHPRITTTTQPNRGASAARNHGLRLARGDFIQFLDADDLLAPEKIAAQVELLQRSPALSLASGRWARFTTDPASARFDEAPNQCDLSGVEFLQRFYEHGAMMQPAAWLAPRALLEKTAGWDESLSLNDDGEYFARVMLQSSGIRFCPAARIYYRSSVPGSLSRRRDARALDSTFRATESIVRHLLAADSGPRSRAAAAYAWKWTAFELYPEAAKLTRDAEQRCTALGGSARPFPAGPRFQWLARLLGWRLAKRLRTA